MLGKLFKHEIRATGRTFLPLYGALLILTIFTKIVMAIGAPNILTDSAAVKMSPVTEIILGIMFTLYFVLVVALCVMTLVVIIQRFYKNLFTDEGYLMFTLPVKTWELVFSKLVVGLIWCVICGIMLVISGFILSLGSFTLMEVMQSIGLAYSDFQAQFGISLNVILFELFLFMLVGGIASILMIYASIAIGQLFDQHRILAAFGAYIVITIVLQIIASVLMAFGVVTDSYLMLEGLDALNALQWFLNGTTVFNLILCVLFYFGTQYIMQKHLNLE
jgi:hypothetical protein